MNINEYVRNFKSAASRWPFVPRVVCADGFSISIQCNHRSYCLPQQDYTETYHAMELGYPSSLDEVTKSIIGDYAETRDTTETVFGYVPTEIIDQLLEAHGGIKWVDINDTLVDIKFAPLLTSELRT